MGNHQNILTTNMKLNLRHLPVSIAAILLVVIAITTFLAFHFGHITAVVPYISDTGTIPPESCIFGQALNITWILFSFAIYCKYLQVKDILHTNSLTHKNNLNWYTCIVGLLSAFGISIVANFQETNAFIVHWFGALMCFGLGSIYLCMQTSLSLVIAPIVGNTMTAKVRMLISAVAITSFIIYFSTGMISYTEFDGSNYLHWLPEHGGYKWHLTSTITELICSLSIITFLLSFRGEFKHTFVHEPVIETGLSMPSKENVSTGQAKKTY